MWVQGALCWQTLGTEAWRVVQEGKRPWYAGAYSHKRTRIECAHFFLTLPSVMYP